MTVRGLEVKACPRCQCVFVPWCGVANGNPENERHTSFCNMQLTRRRRETAFKKTKTIYHVCGGSIDCSNQAMETGKPVENAIIEDVEAVTDAQKKPNKRRQGY